MNLAKKNKDIPVNNLDFYPVIKFTAKLFSVFASVLFFYKRTNLDPLYQNGPDRTNGPRRLEFTGYFRSDPVFSRGFS